jgi:predicted alpha/beta-hydrolase family hydrolase
MRHVPSPDAEALSFAIDGEIHVSGLLQVPSEARACLVLAHGAGAGMNHPFMATIAVDLAKRGIGTLRYQFPYMEHGGKRPDPPQRAHATVRAAVAASSRLVPNLPLFTGGKSFGGRMTSQAQALIPLPAVRGLIFLGFPLHPAGNPSQTRGKHLFDIRVPMLFLQGTRDSLAELAHVQSMCRALGPQATLALLEGADHSFHVPARSGRPETSIRNEMLNVLTAWIDQMID